MNRNNVKRAPMMLQLFAEPSPEPSEPNDPSPAPPAPKSAPKSFDDILKDENFRLEYERRMKTELSAQEGRLRALYDEKTTEAERLAKMTKEEKNQYLLQKREKELAGREAEIARRELMAVAKGSLTEKGLPISLAEFLDYSDANRCNQSIATLEEAFKQAVQAQVDAELKGGTPPKKAPQNEPVTKEQFAKLGYKERLELKTNRPELYRQLTGK